jgi:two-component system phosphate regulon sensor histidine kinase PhoR
MTAEPLGKTISLGPLFLVERLKANRAALIAGLAVVAVLYVVSDASHALLIAGASVIVLAALLTPPPKPPPPPTDWELEADKDPLAGALLEALLEPGVLLTARGTIYAFNDAAAEKFGDLRGGDPISFALRLPEVLEAVREVGAGGVGRIVEYVERVPVDRWIEARIGPVWLDQSDRDDGAPKYVLLILHDLTDIRRAERMRVDFVANASHELRTPLAALLGFVETLQGPAKDDVEARGRFLDIMKSQANRMSRLVDDLLHLSRIEQREHIKPRDSVEIVEIVKSVIDSLAPLARERGVEVVKSFPSEPVPARGDRDELIRVFENLIENAIKYGQSGKKVDVSVTTDKGKARVNVRDYGPGIPHEHLPRLTERFYRVDVGDSREKGGTGLGLAIVKHIMSRHRGRLLIESPGEGQGASFTAVIDLDEGKDDA